MKTIKSILAAFGRLITNRNVVDTLDVLAMRAQPIVERIAAVAGKKTPGEVDYAYSALGVPVPRTFRSPAATLSCTWVSVGRPY
jgi:hypothetical protein